MTLHYKWFIMSLSLIFIGCLSEETSKIPDDQAKILRMILRANGYTISDNEWIDNYLEFTSSFPHADLKDRYYLVLPVEESNRLIITKNINQLDHNFFLGVTTHAGRKSGTMGLKKWVDTILIEGDSIINIGGLNVFDNIFRSIPPEIKYLRGSGFAFNYNQITHLPEEIMQLTSPPVLYDSFHIYIDNNKIDTVNISDSLDNWLKQYSSPYWKAGQQPN